MSGEYKYDAFISYRHLSPDKPIAERLQKILEAYVPPKSGRRGAKTQKLRLFRDETELPTSNDLSGDIQHALEQSRFLVVICSEQLEKSKWCMQEIDYFRELHGGSNRQILTVFVGDPDVSPAFPEPLRYEQKTVRLPDGTETVIREEIEPLAANVSAGTLKQSLKRLKVESLRIAAPLLGCGFDDLYQREQRRRNRRRLSGAVAVVAAAAFVAVFSTIAVQQGKQIRYKNAEALVNQSETMENSGGLYDALELVAQALPEKENDPVLTNRAVEQAVSLTGAYQPEIFTAVKKYTFSSEVRELCLMNGGKRLLVISDEEASLWDTQTGERIRVFEGGRNSIGYFHDAGIEGDLSVERYANGQVTVWPKGSKGLVGGRYKAIREEKNVEEDAVFYINEEEGSLSRISPADGSVIWSKEGKFSFLSTGKAPIRRDGLPVILAEQQENDFGWSTEKKSLCVLDFDSGEEIAVIGFNQMEEEIEDFNKFFIYNLFYLKPYTVLLHKGDVHVYRTEKGEAVYLYTIPSVVDESFAGTSPIKDAYLYDGTLLLLGKEKENVPTASNFFYGYDIADGRQLWAFTRKAVPTADYVRNSHIGVFRPSAAEEGGAVAFGLVDSEFFAVDPVTGEAIGSVTLLRTARETYYSENGVVFVVDGSGEEIVFTVNEDVFLFDKMLSDVYIVKTREFGTELAYVSYCNNMYAVVREGRSNEAVIYATVENESDHVVFQLEEKNGLYDGMLNADRSLLVTRNYSKKELYVIDAETGDTVSSLSFGDEYVESVCFWGDESLAVVYSEKICVYDALTGELTAEYETDSYSNAEVVGASREVLYKNENTIVLLKPDGDPETVFDLEAYLQRDAEGGDLQHFYCSGCLVSPSGRKLVVVYQYGDFDKEQETRLCVFDRETGVGTELEAPELKYSSDIIAAVWSAEEDELCLLTEKEVAGYRCKTGETVFRFGHNGSLCDVVMVENKPYALDNAGTLRPIDAASGKVGSGKSILLDKTVYIHSLEYQPVGGGKGFLRCGAAAWLIDAKNTEIVFEIDDFIGYDPAVNRIYRTYYNSIRSYPMFSGFALRQKAEAVLR